MRFSKQFFILVLICVSTASIVAQEIPVAILNALRNKPEGYHVGIGMARAESEWESMSLAMTRARVQIARELSSEVHEEFSDFTVRTDLSDVSTAFQEDIVEVLSTAHLKGARIIDLTKTTDGTWWCAIYMPKNLEIISPVQINFSDFLLYDLSRVSSISNPRVVSDINLWINHIFQRQPEGWIYTFGVARLGTDTASFNLAKERAIQSIAYTLYAEISSTVTYYSLTSDNDPDDSSEQFNESISVKSEHENTYLPLGLVDFVKIEDGSLWVAVGCPVYTVASETWWLSVPASDAFDAEARMDEYLRADREAKAEQRMHEAFRETIGEEWF